MRRESCQANIVAGWSKATFVGLALLLAACSRGGAAWRQADAPSPPNPEESGYLRPPLVLDSQRGADGAVTLSGRSAPQVRVRFSGPPPTGAAYGATADDKGNWSVATPLASEVRLFGVAEELVGRDVLGEGYVAVLPSPGPGGAILRAGGGAAVLARPAGMRIAAVDYDSSGAAVVSGFAKPGATARLFIDGTPVGEARANDRGRFSVSLSAGLKPGDHEARVESGDQSAAAKFSVDPPRPVSGLPYRGERSPVGWRVDWLTPGGGEQTTLILDTAES